MTCQFLHVYKDPSKNLEVQGKPLATTPSARRGLSNGTEGLLGASPCVEFKHNSKFSKSCYKATAVSVITMAKMKRTLTMKMPS